MGLTCPIHQADVKAGAILLPGHSQKPVTCEDEDLVSYFLDLALVNVASGRGG
jgi:hypothetical protein